MELTLGIIVVVCFIVISLMAAMLMTRKEEIKNYRDYITYVGKCAAVDKVPLTYIGWLLKVNREA